jgi:cell division protein FtsQ
VTPVARPERGARGAAAKAAPPRGRPVARRRSGRFRAVWASGQFVALLGALICGGAIGYLLNAGALGVRELAISGAAATTPEQIAAAGGVTGHNIFTVDPQIVAERLIALPTVREAQVWGELPDRLVVRVVERQPALVWQVGDDRFLLDAGGFVIAQNPAAETTQALPRVAVSGVAAPQVGGRVDTAPLGAALAITRHAPDYGLTISGIEYASPGGITIVTTGGGQSAGGRRIVIGDGERIDEKLAASAAILKSDQTWTILNVTDPDRPFFPAR